MARQISMESLDKRDAIKRDEILDAVVKSNKSYNEILKFLESDGSISE